MMLIRKATGEEMLKLWGYQGKKFPVQAWVALRRLPA